MPESIMIDRTEALERMDHIALALHKLEDEQRNLRIEYWGLQAVAYPFYECNHPDNYACKHCLPTREDV